MPKFSVVVPIYNVEAYIKDCVESLQNQTLKEIEIILVDDGSPDNSGSIIDDYASKDERIKVIHKANGGVSAARNDGLKVATGEYVLFCDSDDMMEIDACEKLYKAGIDSDADVVIGDVYRIIDGEKKYAQFLQNHFARMTEISWMIWFVWILAENTAMMLLLMVPLLDTEVLGIKQSRKICLTEPVSLSTQV